MATAHFQLLVSAVAGWVNRHQQDVIEYLQEENRVLREQLGGYCHVNGYRPGAYTISGGVRRSRLPDLVPRQARPMLT